MGWIEFHENAPTPTNAIFWHEDGYWFEGTLINDDEYGICISTFESYVGIEGITHYLIPTTP